jgi:hypothetical protein
MTKLIQQITVKELLKKQPFWAGARAKKAIL